MKKIIFCSITFVSLSTFAYDYKTAEEVCGNVTGILSSAPYVVNSSDASTKFKMLSMIVNGKESGYNFDNGDFASQELHKDAKEMVNTALANPNLEFCLKGTSKNNIHKNGTVVESFGFQWVQVRLRVKKPESI